MPGFSENLQPNRSGEKSEKPKKAERETNTAGEVSEGVKKEKEWVDVQRFLKRKKGETKETG